MQSVTLKRKERIMRERALMAKGRRTKVVGYVLAGSVAANVVLSANVEKTLACSDTYVVQKGDNLYTLAQKYSVTVEQLQEANELSSYLIKEGQVLEVPILENTHSEQEELRATKMEVHPKQGPSAVKMEVHTVQAKKSQSTTKKQTNRVHTVVKGDSLYLLAKKYGVRIEQIQNVNGLTSDLIVVGQKLRIPSDGAVKAKKLTIPNRDEKMTYATYTVAPGETLWSIARQFNMSIDQLKANNNMSSNAVLIGQKLTIKQKNLMKVNATVSGAVDNFSVEFMMNGEPIVLQVAYGTASNFEHITGKKVELVFYKANRSALVSYSLAK